MKINKVVLFLLGIFLVLVSTPTAQAALTAVGPTNPANGFPVWYQDSTALALELCLPNTQELADGACLLLPADVPNPAAPIVFPTNYPGEGFWFAAGAIVDVPAGGALVTAGSADVVLGLEATFATGAVIAGDQVTFGRVRIRVDVPQAGTYTVTHPFGIQTFVVVNPGIRAINVTSDIGIGAAGDFTGALNSAIGPFLRAALTPGGAPLPYFDLYPGSGKLYIGPNPAGTTPGFPPDGTTKVTGGPFGNVFRVDGPNIGGSGINSVETIDFSLVGRVFNGVLPTPLTVTRTTYGRTAAPSSGQVDVFATSAPTAQLTVNGSGVVPSWPMTGDGTGRFFAHIPIADATILPAFLEVMADNTQTNPNNSNSTIASNLVDLVGITQADYDVTTGNLTVSASSSDLLAPTPQLSAVGFNPGILVLGTLVTATAAPPSAVNVISAKGGQDTQKVAVAATFPAGALAPVARNDSATTAVNTPIAVNVLTNDLALESPFTLDPATIIVTAAPANGTAVPNPAAGAVTYTPNPVFTGTDSFQYTVQDNDAPKNTSNAATVQIIVRPRPGAVNDTAVTTANVAVIVNILTNDTPPPGGSLIPSTVTIVPGTVINGTAVVNALNGTVTFTPAPGVGGVTPGVGTFQYTVADNLSVVSLPATVTVTVNPLNPTPVANNDTATTNQGQTVVIPVLANDFGTLNFATLAIVSPPPPAQGTATVNTLQGTITYTPPLSFFGLATFTYNVRNTLNVFSNTASVSVTVNALVETVTIDRAEYNIRLRQWTVAGRTTVLPPPANTMTIRTGATPGAGTVIGTATVAADGKWSFNQANSAVPFNASVNVRSSFGASATATVRQR